MRICFVALEILGPFNGGGIATALAGQAEHHAADHDVTVLYVHPSLSAEESPKWESFYGERNIRFIRAEFDTFYPLDSIAKRSFAIKQYLEEWAEEFDVIYFHDYLGLGYYTALSRRLGLGFEETRIGTCIHGPSEWARTLNMVTDKAQDITLYELERKQVEYSDFVVAPSQDIIDWCIEQGWTLPSDSRPVSNLLPHRLDLHTGLKQGDVVTEIDEVCFFGRLEIRKGIFTFLEAIKYLHKNQLTLPKKVTFLGGFCINGFRNSASTVLEYTEKWDCEFQFLNNYSHEQAISYLVENKPLTILPSRDESFGLTAYECLSFGVPALISARGALRTLAAEPERDKILFDPSANILARKISDCLDNGAVIAAVDPMHLNASGDWDKLLSDLDGPTPKPDPHTAVVSLDTDQKPVKASKKAPLVSVILVHHNRAQMLRGALESLIAQVYEKIEIIIVDDGSLITEYNAVERLVEELDDKRIKVVRQENRYLGAARNFGTTHAKGDYFLFMDDDNFAMPEEIETFVKVALATGADVLNTVSKMFRTAGLERQAFDIYLPVGPSLQLSVLGNTFGDANSLVKREAFEDIGGFTEKYAIGCEDYELFTRAFLSGKKMQILPELLFEYRSEDEGMMKELNSGKYIINQLRGVTALFDTHRQIDLSQMRGLLRFGFHAAVSTEYDYWLSEGAKQRKHPKLETELAHYQGAPNGAAACEIIAQMLSAAGKLSEAVRFMERNKIIPKEPVLKSLQQLYSKHEARKRNSGAQSNIVLNSVFEFWTAGNRYEGVGPYQYIANEWLMPSPKFRPNMIVSQRSDSALFAITNARNGTYLHIQQNAPDPEGYLFLSQRNFEMSNTLERELDFSMLVRGSYDDNIGIFLRVTADPSTENFKDVHPVKMAQVSQQWNRQNLSFDLSDFNLADMKTHSFISIFIAIPSDRVLSLDITDITLVPKGDNVTIAPYVHALEMDKAQHRCFTVGRDALVYQGDDGRCLMDLTPIQAEKIAWDSRFQIVSRLVVLLANGEFEELNVTAVEFDHSGPGVARLKLTLDEELSGKGVVIDDFVVVTNYLEG